MPLLLHAAVLVTTIGLASPAFAATPWEKWLAAPTAAATRHVSKIEYSNPTAGRSNEVRTTAGLRVLAAKVGRADKESFQLAVRLVQTTDGVTDVEDLYAMLGKYVRLAPEDYLKSISALSEPHICAGVSFLGEDFVDKPELRVLELETRRRALQNVHAPALMSLRNTCLSKLWE